VFARGYKRTCSDCGYSWEVSRFQARLRPEHSFHQFILQAFSNAGGRSSGVAARSLRFGSSGSNDLGDELISSITHCARCGSGRYTQTPLKEYTDPLD
jgi:ribosomal protein L37E